MAQMASISSGAWAIMGLAPTARARLAQSVGGDDVADAVDQGPRLADTVQLGKVVHGIAPFSKIRLPGRAAGT